VIGNLQQAEAMHDECTPLSYSPKTCTELYKDVKDFPPLKDDHLLMHSTVNEIDPRSWKCKSAMDVFLFEEYLVFVTRKEKDEIKIRTTDCVLKLSEMHFFLDSSNILSVETSSGQSFGPDGSFVRQLKIPEDMVSEWVTKLRRCDVRLEMKDRLQELPNVLENEEFNFNCNNSKRKIPMKISGDYRNRPIGDSRPRSYSHDSPSHSSDLSFALPQPLSTSTNSSIKSGDSSDSSGSQHRSNIARSLSVGNNSNTVTMSAATVTKPHSLPSNLKTMKIKRTSNSKFYQCIFRIGKLSRGDQPPPSSICKNIGSRYAKPSPELKCKSSHEEREPVPPALQESTAISILSLKPAQVAQELTRYTAELLQDISPAELRAGAWTNKSRHTTAPNLVKMIDFHQHLVSCHFTEWILNETTPERRAKVLKRLITVADECKQLNNFETVHAIVTALTLDSIRRLSQTWDLISPSTRKTFSSLHSLVHMRGRWSNYKTALEAAKRKGYFIPMLAVFLNQVEHEHAFYSKDYVEKLVFPSEDINYSWTELSQSGEFHSEKVSEKMSGSLSKWLRSKSLSTSSSPLRSHIEDKLRENVQSIVEQTNSCGQTNNLTVEETPLYTLRLYQQNSAQYDIPSSPVITKFLRIPFSQCQAAGGKWKESWERQIHRSEALEPPT